MVMKPRAVHALFQHQRVKGRLRRHNIA